MYEIIEIKNKKYIKIVLIPVIQKEAKFFVAKMKASDFLNLYAVEPTEYDYKKEISMANIYSDQNDYYESRLERLKQKKTDPFQREDNESRLKEISKFITEEKYAFFPNSIIVTCDLINDFIDNDEDTSIHDIDNEYLFDNLSYLENKSDSYHLYIPYESKSILIIDGQHRVKGLEKCSDDILENYELLLTFLVGFDRSVIAKQFYTINYTQKSVNKSLLYHLSAEFSDELDEITYLHEVIRVLNNVKTSPFLSRIKMLGVAPKKEYDKKERKYFTISQAFLIDYLLKTINSKANNSIYAPIFLYYYKKKELQIEVIKIISKYFNAIKSISNSDWNDTDSVLCKTVGVGAFIRVLHFIYVKLFYDKYNGDPVQFKNITSNDFKTILNGIEKIDFSKKGPLGRVASASQLNKVKELIIVNVPFFEAKDYESFIENYKIIYFPKFKNWLEENI